MTSPEYTKIDLIEELVENDLLTEEIAEVARWALMHGEESLSLQQRVARGRNYGFASR